MKRPKRNPNAGRRAGPATKGMNGIARKKAYEERPVRTRTTEFGHAFVATERVGEVPAMYRMEASERNPLPRVVRPLKEAESTTHSARRVASAHSLMPAGGPSTGPLLDGIPHEYRLVDGIELAAALGKTLLAAGLATPEQWTKARRDPFRFLEHVLKARIAADGGSELEKEFFLRLGVTSTLDPYDNDAEHAGDAGEMFLVLEPDSAGYVVIGPTLRLLETVHPRLPATFFDLFTSALNRWLRVYDYRDALARVEMLRDWYEADPEGEAVELPAVEDAVPACLGRGWHPVKKHFLQRMVPRSGTRGRGR